MDKKEFRVLIKHCFLAKKSTAEAKAWLDKHYSDCAPGKSTVEKWFAKFKRGEMSTEDDARCGRPKEAVTDENIKKVHKIISENRKVKLIEIAETLKISKERVGHIVNEYLGMRKLSSKWVSREFTIDEKQRIDDSEQCLDLFNGTTVLSDGSKIKHPVEDEHSYASSSCSGCFNCLTSEVEIKKEPNEEASNSEIKEIKMELNEPILHSENDIKVESVEHCQISPNYLCQRLESKIDIKTEPKEEHNDLQSYCDDHSNLLHSEIDIKMDPNEGYS